MTEEEVEARATRWRCIFSGLCSHCSKLFFTFHTKGMFCSLGCKNKVYPGGPGKVVILKGYEYLWMIGHPSNAAGRGYVAVHRLVMEKRLGRYLLKGENVHHVNVHLLREQPRRVLEVFESGVRVLSGLDVSPRVALPDGVDLVVFAHEINPTSPQTPRQAAHSRHRL